MTKTDRRSPLARHASGDCGCTPEENPNDCPYQVFCDGWDFTPEVGNGRSRGEIFTPRFVVDRMIVAGGILPAEAVYDGIYDTDEASLEQAFDRRVLEPAVGTGNFLSTICHHRTRYALAAADDHDTLAELLIRLTSTLYAFDIDPGNAEVTIRRLLDGDTTRIDSPEVVADWVQTLAENLEDPDEAALTGFVTASLAEAERNWRPRLTGQGVLSRAWHEATGSDLPEDLYDALAVILEDNVKVFDGLSPVSTATLPGSAAVQWTWRDETGRPIKKVSHGR